MNVKDIVDSEDELIKDMDSIVTEISKDRRLRHIMTLADEMVIEKRIEHELGVKEGIAQGKLEAAKKMKEDSSDRALLFIRKIWESL